MHLILVRHGEADPGFPDDERQLTESGRTEARRTGAELAARFTPTVLLVSPLVRTQQTADCIAEHLWVPRRENRDWLVHQSTPQRIISGLEDVCDEPCVVLVTHQPLLSRIQSWLLNGTDRADPSLPFMTPGSWFEVELPIVERGCGTAGAYRIV
jgi:phosphohistidine phosphatase